MKFPWSRKPELLPELLLFAGGNYYPDGGARDYRMRGTVEQCKAHFSTCSMVKGDSMDVYDDMWGQIVDPQTMTVLQYGQKDTNKPPRWVTPEVLDLFGYIPDEFDLPPSTQPVSPKPRDETEELLLAARLKTILTKQAEQARQEIENDGA